MNNPNNPFTRNDLFLEKAIELLENLVNSINGDVEMNLHDQEQAHAFIEAYYKNENEVNV